MAKPTAKAELRLACYTTGIKPTGYTVHVAMPNPGITGKIYVARARDAFALQRAIRGALAANPGSK